MHPLDKARFHFRCFILASNSGHSFSVPGFLGCWKPGHKLGPWLKHRDGRLTRFQKLRAENEEQGRGIHMPLLQDPGRAVYHCRHDLVPLKKGHSSHIRAEKEKLGLPRDKAPGALNIRVSHHFTCAFSFTGLNHCFLRVEGFCCLQNFYTLFIHPQLDFIADF